MTDPAPELAIETRHVWKRFRGQPAVRDLSLKVRTGTTFGFIGLNGAGKSTTIRMLMGLLKPSAGEVRLRGVPLPSDRIHALAGVGYVPDRPNVYPWMRISEAISFCRSLRRKWNDQVCEDLLNRFELQPRQRVKKLSKGQAAKLSLLLAVSHDPDILILDEPMDGLDPLARDEFLGGVLEAVCGEERTVLLSSHSLLDVQRLADEVGLIHEGTLLVQCPLAELVSGTKRIRAVLEDGAPTAAAPPGTVCQHLEGREWQLTVRGCSPQTIADLQSSNRARVVDVLDLNLDEVFKDLIRGQRALRTAPQEMPR